MTHLSDPLAIRDITLRTAHLFRPCASTPARTGTRPTGISCIWAAGR